MSDLIVSLRLLLASLVACSVIYPAAVWGFAVVAAPQGRHGSLIRNEAGTVVGSRLLAQSFTRPEYFWPRPSACDYNASAAGGSNLSPTSPQIAERARVILARLGPVDGHLAPADLVTASGSGLDPHISLAGALVQVPRVALARKLPASRVEELVRRHCEERVLVAFSGKPIVNVLELNLALDRATREAAISP
jgi:K+-transporting ATPase ATPase C chain